MDKHIKVASYNNLAFEEAWKGRSRGLWGTSAVGLAFGAAVGAIAPFFPCVMGANPAIQAALVPGSMAVFAASGLAAGFANGIAVGIASGAAGGVAKEQEKRSRARDLALGIATPETEAALSAPTPEPAPDTRTRWQRMKDAASTYVNFKVGAAFALLGAIGGAVMAASYFALGGLETGGANAAVPYMAKLLGPQAVKSAPQVLAYFVGVTGIGFGGLWAFNLPKITGQMQQLSGDLSSGKLLNTQWGPERAVEPALTPSVVAEPAPSHILPEAQAAQVAFFQEMLSRQVQTASVARQK